VTQGPAAGFDVFIWVTGAEQHFSYADKAGTIWDAYYTNPVIIVEPPPPPPNGTDPQARKS
jgi:hypothetical protein